MRPTVIPTPHRPTRATPLRTAMPPERPETERYRLIEFVWWTSVGRQSVLYLERIYLQ